jgi:Asp-tRNA(Asn)/Glu-tRNA(Gln) amidotransferase C subunit
LQTVDLKDVAPTSQVTGLKNVTRPDTVQDYGVSTKALLRNAPAIAGAHIKVKRMLE